MWVVKLWDRLDESLAMDHVESSMTLGLVHMMGSPKTQGPLILQIPNWRQSPDFRA